MIMTGLPWIDLSTQHLQRCQQAAWLTYNFIEREQVLNMRSCTDWWLQGLAPATAPMQLRSHAWPYTAARNQPCAAPRVSASKP